MSWQDTPLSSLADVRSGGGAPQKADAFSDSGHPFVRAGSLVKLLSGTPENALEKISPEVARSHGLKLFPSGTVLFAKSGMSATKGHIYALREMAYVVNHLAALVPHKPTDSAFLSHALQQFSPTSLIKDPAYPSIRLGDIENMNIFVPRDSKMRARIAAILDQANTLRRKRREEIEVLERLSQAIYDQMFGDPVKNPRNWPSIPLTEVCHCYSGGTPSKSNDAYWRGSLPWFSAKDLKEDDLFDSIDHIDADVTESTSLKLLPPNTVAIVVRGMILAHTFKVCVLRVAATINQDLKALLPHEPIDAQFLASTLRAQASFVLQQVSEAGHGTKRLDAEALGKINILLPPIGMRQEYTEQVSSIQAQMELQRKSLEKFDALFASLQHRAFRGEL